MQALSRDLELLTARTFDVLVVGGGIYGLTIANDAAQRGLSVALVERGDFGSGSSFNHLRTIHGGLRYLQSLDIGRARESLRERRTLAIIAPHAVQPMPFALPETPVRERWDTLLDTADPWAPARRLRAGDRYQLHGRSMAVLELKSVTETLERGADWGPAGVY